VSRSIRRTLLSWYALILVLVLGTFGGLLYHHRQRALFEQVDAEIEAQARALAGTVEWEPGEGLDLESAEIYARRFDAEAPGKPYCLVLDPDGAVLLRSAGAPDALPLPAEGAREPWLRDRGDLREVVVKAPRGTRVAVGRDRSAAERELAAFLPAILAAGAATLLLSLAGGWFLVGRLLAPIRRMTQAAERISHANLSERIDVGRTETELGRLAGTLNRAFDRLEAAFDRQARFTADASHELRTPLSIVVSNAECGLRRDRTAEDYREALETCLRAGRRMAGVVEGLLVLARADAGEIEIEREPVDLRALLEETIEFLAPVAAEHGVTLALDGENRPATVRGDAAHLRNAIGNLVSNAIRYNREGGRVDVSLAVGSGESILAVADTGVGIPEADRERVFERFFRVDTARSRDAGGSGLGLAIASWVVRAHGGRIALESEEGQGTTVTVRLPSAPGEDGGRAAP
jgi:heavy metal sensor kinase